MNKFQNYLHYKLPITINPLEYGKLIEQIDNKYFIQINKMFKLMIKISIMIITAHILIKLIQIDSDSNNERILQIIP